MAKRHTYGGREYVWRRGKVRTISVDQIEIQNSEWTIPLKEAASLLRNFLP